VTCDADPAGNAWLHLTCVEKGSQNYCTIALQWCLHWENKSWCSHHSISIQNLEDYLQTQDEMLVCSTGKTFFGSGFGFISYRPISNYKPSAPVSYLSPFPFTVSSPLRHKVRVSPRSFAGLSNLSNRTDPTFRALPASIWRRRHQQSSQVKSTITVLTTLVDKCLL
jgi:hypothetical protein